MRRLPMKRRGFKGEITAFLSLIFLLVLSLIGAMVQSASIHITKSMKRADTKLALESVFAEYHQKLFEEYEVFAKEGSVELDISRRLWFYGAKNMEHTIQKIQLLSDYQGQAFYEQAVRAMGGEKAELSLPEGDSVWEEEQEVTQSLEKLLQEEEQTLPNENNPIDAVNQLKQSNLLAVVVPNPEELSNRAVETGVLPSHRTLKVGQSASEKVEHGVTQKVLLAMYLTEHFHTFAKQDASKPLLYEAEYLIGGCESDRENLEIVAGKLLALRSAVNYAYLMTDQTRQAEAEALALGLASLLASPEASKLVKQAILFAWAYGESILDVRALLRGDKVPLAKSDSTWKLQLENLVKLGTAEEEVRAPEASDGIDYETYLRMLLMLEKDESLCMRALDLLEINLGIRVDECVTALEIQSVAKLQRGVQDTFLTSYQYQ